MPIYEYEILIFTEISKFNIIKGLFGKAITLV